MPIDGTSELIPTSAGIVEVQRVAEDAWVGRVAGVARGRVLQGRFADEWRVEPDDSTRFDEDDFVSWGEALRPLAGIRGRFEG